MPFGKVLCVEVCISAQKVCIVMRYIEVKDMSESVKPEESPKDLGKILKQQRIMVGLTLNQLSAMSGVSQSHLSYIEKGKRFPSVRILLKVAKPLSFEEDVLFTLVFAKELVAVQRIVIPILCILKRIAREYDCNMGFTEYARRKYPELDENVLGMIEDIIKGARELTKTI